MLTVGLINTLCGRAAMAGGGVPVRVIQIRARAVVAAGTLASELALQAWALQPLDQTVLLLQLFRQSGRRWKRKRKRKGISHVGLLADATFGFYPSHNLAGRWRAKQCKTEKISTQHKEENPKKRHNLRLKMSRKMCSHRTCNFQQQHTAGKYERGVHSKRHAVCLDQTRSQVQLLPGVFSQREVLLDKEAEVLLQQLSLAL